MSMIVLAPFTRSRKLNAQWKRAPRDKVSLSELYGHRTIPAIDGLRTNRTYSLSAPPVKCHLVSVCINEVEGAGNLTELFEHRKATICNLDETLANYRPIRSWAFCLDGNRSHLQLVK